MHLLSSQSAARSEGCSLYHKKLVAFGILPLTVMSSLWVVLYGVTLKTLSAD